MVPSVSRAYIHAMSVMSLIGIKLTRKSKGEQRMTWFSLLEIRLKVVKFICRIWSTLKFLSATYLAGGGQVKIEFDIF